VSKEKTGALKIQVSRFTNTPCLFFTSLFCELSQSTFAAMLRPCQTGLGFAGVP